MGVRTPDLGLVDRTSPPGQARWALSLIAAMLSVPVSATADADPILLFRDPAITEASGLDLSATQRLMWTHNDAGDDPVVFAVSPAGPVRLRVVLHGVRGEDWEDISVARVAGTDYVYVADTGDGRVARDRDDAGARTEFEVVRFAEPVVTAGEQRREVVPERFRLSFGGSEVNVESLAVSRGGCLIFVEKTRSPATSARVWTVRNPSASRVTTPVLIGQIPVVGASGADLLDETGLLAVRNAESAYLFEFVTDCTSIAEDPSLTVALPHERQGEGVAFSLDGRGLVTVSEGSAAAVWFVALEPGAAPLFAPLLPPPSPESGAPTDLEDPSRSVLLAAVAAGTLIVLLVGRLGRPSGWSGGRSERGRTQLKEHDR